MRKKIAQQPCDVPVGEGNPLPASPQLFRNCVYVLLCNATGKFYIGSSLDGEARIRYHLRELKLKTHVNKKLQRVFDKYGDSALTGYIVEYTAPKTQLLREQAWLDAWFKYAPKRLLNIATVATRPPLFHELPDDVRARMQESRSRQTAALHRDPAFASRRDALFLKIRSDPKFAAASAERSRTRFLRMHADPAYRAEHAERSRENGSRTFKKLHADPEFQKRTLERVRKLHADPEVQLRQKEASRAASNKACRRVSASGEVMEFASGRAAAKQLGIERSSISGWCRGVWVPKDGSKWEYL